MNAFQSILASYAILIVVAAMVPFIRFMTRRTELSLAIGQQRHAELYPLVHHALFGPVSLVFTIAFFFEEPLKKFGVPFVTVLSQIAPVFYLFVLIYTVARSVQLLRRLPVEDVAAREFVRMNIVASSVAAALIVLFLCFVPVNAMDT